MFKNSLFLFLLAVLALELNSCSRKKKSNNNNNNSELPATPQSADNLPNGSPSNSDSIANKDNSTPNGQNSSQDNNSDSSNVDIPNLPDEIFKDDSNGNPGDTEPNPEQPVTYKITKSCQTTPTSCFFVRSNNDDISTFTEKCTNEIDIKNGNICSESANITAICRLNSSDFIIDQYILDSDSTLEGWKIFCNGINGEFISSP